MATAEAAPAATPVPPPAALGSSAVVRGDNSLIAEVRVALDREAAVYVEYANEAAGRFRTATSPAPALEHIIPVVRLRPSSRYTYRVFALDPAGTETEVADGSFTTGPLPEALGSIELTAQGSPTPELVLMDYRDVASIYIVALDQGSNIVWYYASPNPFPPAAAGIQAVRQKPDFNLVYYQGSPRTPCCLVEITPLGAAVDRLVFNDLDDIPHHDHLVLPDNNGLYLAEETRVIDDTANGGDAETSVTGDVIRIWDQGSGATEEVWNSFDHLSTDVRVVWGEGNPRWTHFNSIQLGPRGNVVVSSRNRNQVISISPDYQSVEWFLGGPNSFFTFPDLADRFYRQHAATELRNGNVLVFDNGAGRPEEEGGEYSRALELALSDYEITATKVWEYRAVPDIYASFISSAYRLENGNTLVNFGTTTNVVALPITLVEVERDGTEVWKLEMSGPSLRNRYRAHPLESIMGESRQP